MTLLFICNTCIFFIVWMLQQERVTTQITSCADMEPTFACPMGYTRQDLNESNANFYDLTVQNDTFFQNPVNALYPRGTTIQMKKHYVYRIRSGKNNPKNVQVHCLSAEIEKSKNIQVIFKQYVGQPRGKKKHFDRKLLDGKADIFLEVLFTLPVGGVSKAEKIKIRKVGNGSWQLRNLHMLACHRIIT